MKKIAVGTAAFVLAMNAYAVNKCVDANGTVTYQETACPGTAKAAQAVNVGVASVGPAPKGEELEKRKQQCIQMLKGGVLWKDPDSIQIKDVVRLGQGTSFKMDGSSVIRYAAQVNGKNSYGGYTGFKLAVCEFDLSEKSIIHVHVAKD